MLKIMRDKWEKNWKGLESDLSRIADISKLEYKDLVKLTFARIYNKGDEAGIHSPYKRLDLTHITQIDNGDYQGTLIYLIPFDTYQPSEGEYLMTYVGYGSCSGCDTLLSIIDYYPCRATEKQVSQLLALCKDIVTNTIKPYNYGWRSEEIFEVAEV